MSEKILVVDDDVDSLKLIGLMLKRQGYEVIAANAGNPALSKAYEEQPDLIILDVMMPDMDGYEVTRKLRTEDSTKDIPIIMFTAKTLVDDKVAGFEAGVDDYLTKPTHPAELSSRVKAVLARSQAKKSGAAHPSASGRSLSLGFLGVKGGVGTSALAASIAGRLAQNGETVLADLRPGQGTLGISLGIGNAKGIANVMKQPVDDINKPLVEENLIQHPGGLKLLLSSTNPQESQVAISPDAASKVLTILTSVPRYTIFDLGAGLTRTTVRLLRELEHTVLVTEPNRTTLAITNSILRELNSINIPREKFSVVLYNRISSNFQIPWQDVEQILNFEVAAIISADPDLALRAADDGIPITQFEPSSVVAGQISKLADELVKKGK